MADTTSPANAGQLRTRIKICGVHTVVDAAAAVDAGADLIGLVFVEHSPRYVEPREAQRIVDSLPAGVEAVGLFANHTAGQVLEAAETAGLSLVQLHGQEGPGFAKRLKALRIIKAVSFDAGHLADRLQPWREARTHLTALLIDSPPASQALTGGSGHTFDWSALRELEQTDLFRGLPPRYLAGGLTPDNVGQAIATLRPFGVDVSSGVESARGIKDAGKIHAFAQAVRDADAALSHPPA